MKNSKGHILSVHINGFGAYGCYLMNSPVQPRKRDINNEQVDKRWNLMDEIETPRDGPPGLFVLIEI